MSILDLNIDFRFAEGKAPNRYKDLDYLTFLTSNKERAVPCLTFLGPNASGKSNILRALYEFKNIAIHGIANSYRQNRLNKKYNTTVFFLRFVVNNNTYEYSIEYDSLKIHREFLKKNSRELYQISHNKLDFSNIAEKEDRKEKFRNIFHEACLDTYNGTTFFRNSMLSRIKLISPNLNNDILRVFDYISNLKIFPTNTFPYSYSIDLLAAEFGSVDAAFSAIVSSLEKLDINAISKMVFRRTQLEYNESTKTGTWLDNVETYHMDVDKKEVKFNLSEESYGTQLLFGMLGMILYVLKKGQVLVIDEFDRSLHPLLLRAIVYMFKSKTYNQYNAQLVFSCHETSVLEDELLRISEGTFVQNSVNTGTTIKRICDFEGVSNFDNFRKMYMNYQFGAVPYSHI
jgi:AAA15 family ATPase/GTPase